MPDALRKLLPVLGLWVAFLIVTNVVGEAMIRETVFGTDNRWRYDQTQTTDRWVRWDSNWYLRIAKNGYQYGDGKNDESVGFFPLYPIAIRALHGVSWLSYESAAVWVSRLSLLGLMSLLFIWAKEREEDPLAPLIALLFFPSAFILGAAYAESLFVLCVVAAFFFAERKRWWIAALAAFAASATRIHGLLLAPCFFVLFVMHRKERDLRMLLPAVGAGLGCAAYGIYTHVVFGDLLLYLNARSSWDQEPRSPMGPLFGFFGKFYPLLVGEHVPVRRFAQVFCLVGSGWAAWVLHRSKRWHEALLFVLVVAVGLVAGTMNGIQRYLLMCFPLFFLLARLRNRPVLWPSYLFAGAMLQAFNLYRFVTYQRPPP